MTTVLFVLEGKQYMEHINMELCNVRASLYCVQQYR